MNIRISTLIDHKSLSSYELLDIGDKYQTMIMPGGSSCCFACCCCSTAAIAQQRVEISCE